MGRVTAEMKRILDIDKILEDREKEKQRQTKKSKGITQWERMKNDPVKFHHYRRKQYVNKKKEARASPVVTVPIQSRENIISQITDLMCRVDWHDHELRSVWTVLENLRSLLPAGKEAA
jgi:hypothetical protein